MLACNKTLTHVHRVKGANSDEYVCTQIPNCSWFSKLRTSILDRGASMERYTYVRFPVLPDGVEIVKGDYMVNGVVTSITREKDLEGMEYFTILDIADNTRGGGVRLPHWSVVGQ